MSKKIDIVNMKFNHLTVLEDIGGGKVICQCDCENKTVVECYKKNVKDGRQKSCGCASRKKNRGLIVGKQFGNWRVLAELGGGKVFCECQCKDKTTRVLYKKAIINGKTKSCGCLRAQNCNATKQQTGSLETKYKDTQFGEWTVIRRITNSMKLLCRCSCGTEREIYIQNLIAGESKSCGHNMIKNIEGQTFGKWSVVKELGNGKVSCNCSCGLANNRILYKQNLLRGQSKSCGCASKEYNKETMLKKYNDICTLRVSNPREKWQIETLQSKELLSQFIDSLDYEVTIEALANELNVTKSVVSKTLHSYDIFDKICIVRNKSYMENDLLNYIKSIYSGEVIQSDRDILNGQELDIYIPDKKLAIEFNGTYWHSDFFKDKYYHQKKTLLCQQNGVRLVHIFEYEWCNNNKIIKKYLKSLISNDKNVKFARELAVAEVSYSEVEKLLNNNHIQGSAKSSINIALYDKSKIVGVMTFCKPRFDNDAEYELLRLCYLYDVNVIGGTEKMFKYFIEQHQPTSIVSYASLDKFIGSVYLRLGFSAVNISEPDYVWCSRHNRVLSRYQTKRPKLTETDFADLSITEDDDMKELNYYRIYNSGNLKMIWDTKNERK